MATVPRGSIPSMAKEMQGLKLDNREEKAMMVRIGVLIDALVEAQRGLGNPGQNTRRTNTNNLHKPKPLVGSTENLFNAANVSLDPTSTSANLSHQEVQIDTSEGFSNPTTKKVFANNITFKGLVDSTTYNIRARPVTKEGTVGDWAILDPVTTTSSTSEADLDGDSLGATVLSKAFTVSTNAQQFFCGSAAGFIDNSATTTTDNVGPVATATQTLVRDRIDVDGVVTNVEVITFPGFEGTPIDYTAGDGVSMTMRVTRRNPIVFFTLITPSTPTYPATAYLDVQLAQGVGAYASSTKDTVWVEF